MIAAYKGVTTLEGQVALYEPQGGLAKVGVVGAGLHDTTKS